MKIIVFTVRVDSERLQLRASHSKMVPFNILLFVFKLALLASFKGKYSIDFGANERGRTG